MFMFYGCSSLNSINLSSFNTSKVTNMSFIFLDCSLNSINLSSFIISNVTNISGMFYNCFSLNKNNIKCNDQKILDEIE